MTSEPIKATKHDILTSLNEETEIRKERRLQAAGEQFRRERQRRVFIAVTVVSAFIGSFFLIFTRQLSLVFSSNVDSYLYESAYRLFTISGGSLLAISVFSGMFFYLQTGFKFSSDTEDLALTPSSSTASSQTTSSPSHDDVLAIVQNALLPLEIELTVLRNSANFLDDGARSDLINSLRQSLTQEAAASIISELETKITNTTLRDIGERDFHERIRETRMRLLGEVKALQRRGNLNLLFGGTVTAAALYVLWTTVSLATTVNDAKWADNIWSLAIYFGPRLTLALFLQIFAYFFLKLYRASLSEIKYYQNELTNVETKQLAVNAALRNGGADSLKDVVTNLLATERNHILTKDQTTVELEKARLDKDQRSELFKSAAQLFGKKN